MTGRETLVDLLERAILSIKQAKVGISSLMEIIQHGTVKWDMENKSHELAEFLAQVLEGVKLLDHNSAGWKQLQRHVHLRNTEW